MFTLHIIVPIVVSEESGCLVTPFICFWVYGKTDNFCTFFLVLQSQLLEFKISKPRYLVGAKKFLFFVCFNSRSYVLGEWGRNENKMSAVIVISQ